MADLKKDDTKVILSDRYEEYEPKSGEYWYSIVSAKYGADSEEAKARNARMIALTNSDDEKLEDLFDYIIRVPEIDELLSPIIAIIPLQLVAYYIAEFLGKDVDQPRNLAKSVTVE